jgi:hypothetical protein
MRSENEVRSTISEVTNLVLKYLIYILKMEHMAEHNLILTIKALNYAKPLKHTFF